MIQRIFTLAGYFTRSLLLSIYGVLYLTAALVFWWIFFDPRTFTPDVDYYIMLIGLYGAIQTFLMTTNIAANGNRAVHTSLIVRMPRRSEYLLSILLSVFYCSFIIQFILALLSLYHGPNFSLSHLIQIPIIWMSFHLFAGILGLHASNLVAAGWSRVFLYGVFLVCILGQRINAKTVGNLSTFISGLGQNALGAQSEPLGDALLKLSSALERFAENGAVQLGNAFGLPFWPFRTIVSALKLGAFQPIQALAPVLIIALAGGLFAWAVYLFDHKDLPLTE